MGNRVLTAVLMSNEEGPHDRRAAILPGTAGALRRQ